MLTPRTQIWAHFFVADLSRVLRDRTFGHADCETIFGVFPGPILNPLLGRGYKRKDIHILILSRASGAKLCNHTAREI